MPFWVLLILHGPNFWYWFIGPGILFAIEGIGRIQLRLTGKGRTFISSAVLLPSRITHLVIRKPERFHFNPGDYVYVKIPAITSTEWHPFTISSSPELPGIYLTILVPFPRCEAITVNVCLHGKSTKMLCGSISVVLVVGPISYTNILNENKPNCVSSSRQRVHTLMGRLLANIANMSWRIKHHRFRRKIS